MQAAGTTGSAIIRHSLRDGLRLIRDLLGAPGFLATIIRAKQSFVANLTSASGCQDHTTSPSASNALVTHAIRVHRIPAPRIVTIGRNVPLHRGGIGARSHKC
jgi:hypothetical protein